MEYGGEVGESIKIVFSINISVELGMKCGLLNEERRAREGAGL
jgi:hypothetical protein